MDKLSKKFSKMGIKKKKIQKKENPLEKGLKYCLQPVAGENGLENVKKLI